MNSKDAAKELVEKFYNMNDNYHSFQEKYRNAKQCASICVDEIIETYLDIDPKLKYWEEVKREIIKL